MSLFAAADIGSNSSRLLLARAVDSDRIANKSNSCRGELCSPATQSPAWECVLSRRFVTRLGETPGSLSESGVTKTIYAVKEFLKALPHAGVPFFAFATSAVRDAHNKEALLEPLKAMGVNVDVLSGEREAALSCAALPEAGGCVDIGGGSTELLSKSGGVAACRSFDAGAVRAKTLFGEERGALPGAFTEWLRKIFAGVRDFALPAPVFGAGGTITTLAALANGTKAHADQALTRAQLARAMDDIAHTPPDVRRENPLLQDRADIILYGAGILAFLMDELNIETLIATEKDNLYAYLTEMYEMYRKNTGV